MNNRQGTGDTEGTGYSTPGDEQIIKSNSPAVQSPSMTSEERIEAPKPVIETIGEAPGSANPALAETAGTQTGEVSTADMLGAREAAEEELLRNQGAQLYADQTPGATPGQWEQADSSRPNWPNDRRESPAEYMESPRADAAFMSGKGEFDTTNIKGRADALADRAGTQASANESRSGLAPVGMTAEEDKYEEREMVKPNEQSDLDRMGVDMLNVPPGDDDGR